MKTKKRKKRKEKKDTPKNEFIIEENHQQFSRIFTNIAKKMKVKKNFEKNNIKQKKEKPCNPKKQKRNVFLDQI